jgi:hypothetical protein
MRFQTTAIVLATAFIGVSSVQVAAEGAVSFFRDCNYEGAGVSILLGRYDLHQFASVGLYRDDISSMYIDEGMALAY